MNQSPTIASSVPTLGSQPMRITAHAIERYQERVQPGVSAQNAFFAIRQVLAYGTVRTSPRWWTNCRLAPGQRLVYSAISPDACLLIEGDAVLTVLSRELCMGSPLRLVPQPRKRSGRRFLVDAPWDFESSMSIYEPLPADLARVA